ncbi:MULTISPECIES: glutathione S-transferase family protein [Rhodopseudomonas]|uniref:Glutathione S-transferase n=1 Tax=Rhodopseudomonas palustris TaxID=1076 RepID=A0A0D7EY39_RHOPL|nr:MULTISPECIES: glutathione S-transferase family protein [Rhodopseudomonas]KIZ44357.1 glutathione S-transferase [Rhodopseudomonas palustris]MDF3811455.1 glutathione S-transferase family protein [Rhodopseudomonas sp. BAL398]WOK17387.1 glutathione S-transferase family protein [Rhodopseudomonas sp. BAL398]
MSLQLYYHPLSSFCWKVLIALYETDTPFTPILVDLGNPTERAALRALWPIGKFPVLRDDARDVVLPESSIIIEYLATHYPGRVPLIPTETDPALRTRLRDRSLDLYVHLPMQKITGDRLRPPVSRDAHGVGEARTQMRTALDMFEAETSDGGWGIGEAFSLADCAAAPALFYADKVLPFRATHPKLAAYLDRLMARPSFARVLEEAQPYFHLFPEEPAASEAS